MDLVHGPGPWGGPWWSMDRVHGVVHGPRSMFCIRPSLNVSYLDWLEDIGKSKVASSFESRAAFAVGQSRIHAKLPSILTSPIWWKSEECLARGRASNNSPRWSRVYTHPLMRSGFKRHSLAIVLPQLSTRRMYLFLGSSMSHCRQSGNYFV